MKNRADYIKKLSVTAVIMISGMFFYKAFMDMSAIQYVSYHYDPQLSVTIRNAIEKQIALIEFDGFYQAETILKEIQRLFPHVASVSVRTLPYHAAEIEISGHSPVLKINDSFILTEQQSIIPKEYYACYAVDTLPDVQFNLRQFAVSDEMMTAFHKAIKERLFDHFMVQVNREHEWHLLDKQDPAFTVCCNASSLPLGMLKETYRALKNRAQQKGSLKTAWMADLRFNQQIVLSRSKGGHNGKGI